MNGYVYISGQPVQPAEIYSPIEGMEMISDNEVLSVFFKCPPFHSHIPRLLKEVKLPSKVHGGCPIFDLSIIAFILFKNEKNRKNMSEVHGQSVRKQDIFPPPILWHEKSAVRGCLSYERSIHKSISGHRLAELAHRLLSKFYHPKSQKVHGSMELDDADGLTSHANLKATVHGGGTRDNENCIHGGISANHIGTDKLASRVQMACAGKHVGDHGLACFSKSAETVSASGAGAEIVSINVTSRKRRRKQRKFRETGENIDPEKFACPLNLGRAVFEMGTEADKISLENEVTDKHSGETGPNGYACPGVVPIKISVDGKSRKRKRKRKQTKVIVVFDDHAGEKGLACPSNSLPTVSEVGVQADKNCSDSGVPDNTICETGSNGLACHQVPDKSSFDGKSRKRKRKRKQSKVIVVLDDLVCATGLKCHSNLLPVACKVGAGDDKNNVDDGVPDHHVGETGANGLACANGVPDESYVHGKSMIPEQSEVRGALNNHVVAEEFQCTTNLDPTADKNCFDGRILDNSGKTEANRLVCGDGKSRKKRRKKGNATFVVNDHLGAAGLTRPIFGAKSWKDKGTDNRAPDNGAHAGETEQNVLESGPKYP
ncbi:hypothetical protein CJ030_MR6G020533 [Morella rubra]|uniref:Uncharacterized protein n=1 Tax=Morella rubra TaxID=262757 RepID=A0A6A1VA20_9ROSI|nr:hypothetical protein CJ030_MR6G020533 [Morella rubra]